jgi:hypothetical protein
MLVSQNPSRLNAPLGLRLKIDDLRAHLAPLDRYGLPGLGAAITEGARALAGGAWEAFWRFACRGERGGCDRKTA